MRSQGTPARADIAAVYSAGVVQGIALVTFPAAGAIFMSPSHYGLTSTQYGALFIPQAAMAILSSLLGTSITKRLGAARVFQCGLAANLAAMLLLLGSQFVIGSVAYGALLAATSSMGLAFGLTVPTINTLAAAIFPGKADRAVLALNTLLGLGTALAPAFVALFVGFGIWWGLPLLVAVLAAALLLFTLPLKMEAGMAASGRNAAPHPFPGRFWIFAAVALIYGICETMNGNWASIYMAKSLGANPATASLALTVFWGMVTGGRLLFASIGRWFPESLTFVVLPFIITAAFVLAALLPEGKPGFGIGAFALAGFGCSAMLPLMISFGQRQMASVASAVAGGLIAFYQIGYGIAAFGVGPLENLSGWNLHGIFGATTLMGLALAVLTLRISRLTRHKGGNPSTPGSSCARMPGI